MAQFRTDRGLDRLVNFSDAAVAIAITLLILPLADIAVDITKVDSNVGGLIADHWGTFLAFAISFLVIARFWMIHHRVFEFVIGYNSTVVWVNFAWLASIVFLPFSTNVLAYGKSDSRSVIALYIGTLLFTSLVMLVLEYVLMRTPGMLRAEAATGLDLRISIVACVLFVVALILGMIFPKPGMLWLLLLLLQGPAIVLARRLFPRAADRRETTPSA